jgi:hypothetical protein
MVCLCGRAACVTAKHGGQVAHAANALGHAVGNASQAALLADPPSLK